MKPTSRFLLLALVTVFLFGAVRTVYALDPTVGDLNGAIFVTCADPATSHSGEITKSKPIDYYSIDLLANQVLTIDIDAENIDSPLDSLLEVFEVVEGVVYPIDASDDIQTDDNISLDPYLEVTAPPDREVTYYLVISASNPDDDSSNSGNYQFFLTCPEPSTTPVEPVKIGDLLGVTGKDSGLLLTIDPADAKGTVRFPVRMSQITDIEADPAGSILYVAANKIDNGGTITAIDPNNESNGGAVFNYDGGGFIALELAGNTLYGVFVADSAEFSLVTVDQNTGVFSPVIESFPWPLFSLAFNPSENILYGVASTSSDSPSDLIKIDLTATPPLITTIGQTGSDQIVALDFDPNNTLYGVDLSGNLLWFPDLTLSSKKAEIIAPIVVTPEVAAPVSGLTFVVGDSPLPTEPVIGQICSSSLSDSTIASSTSSRSKLSRFKLKRNPLHRAIGLFKFYAEVPNADVPTMVTIRVGPEGEEPAEAGQESTGTTLEQTIWPECKGKGRVFLGLRDKIDGVDLRINKKGTMPLEIKDVELPATGWYYIMVIRPLPRFFRTDYCLSLSTTNSEAANSLQLAWPGDGADNDTATTEKGVAVEPQGDDSTTVAVSIESVNEPANVSAEDPVVSESTEETSGVTAVVQTTATSPEEPVAENSVVEDTEADTGSHDTQPAASIIVDESAATNPDGSAAETPVVDEPAAEADTQPTSAEISDDSNEEYVDDTMRSAPPTL